MESFSSAKSRNPQIESLQNIQYLEHCHPLGVGRQLADLVPAVARTDRSYPLSGMPGEIAQRKPAAVLAHESVNRRRQFASVKSVSPLFGQNTIGARQVWIAKDLSFPGRSPVYRIGRAECPWFINQGSQAFQPRACDIVRHRKPLFGVLNRRRQQPAHRKFPESLM